MSAGCEEWRICRIVILLLVAADYAIAGTSGPGCHCTDSGSGSTDSLSGGCPQEATGTSQWQCKCGGHWQWECSESQCLRVSLVGSTTSRAYQRDSEAHSVKPISGMPTSGIAILSLSEARLGGFQRRDFDHQSHDFKLTANICSLQ